MATLSTAEKAQVTWAIGYLEGNHDLPIDQKVVETLLPMQSKFGFGGGQGKLGLEESLRDAPIRTLLQCLLAVAG